LWAHFAIVRTFRNQHAKPDSRKELVCPKNQKLIKNGTITALSTIGYAEAPGSGYLTTHAFIVKLALAKGEC